MLLQQPIKHIAHEIASEINDYDPATIDRLRDAMLRDEHYILMRKDIFQDVLNDFVSSYRNNAITQDTDHIRENLFQALRFITTGSVKPHKAERTNFMNYHDHEDGCEEVSEEMAEIEARQNGGEISGRIVSGFGISEKEGKYKLKLNPAFIFGSFKGGENQNKLQEFLYKELQNITGHDDLQTLSSEDLYLDAEDLRTICRNLFASLDHEDQSLDAFMKDILLEEVKHDDLVKIEQRKAKIETSGSFASLSEHKPEAEETSNKRMIGLSTALTVISQIIDSPEMKKIRHKYKASERLVKKDLSPLDILCTDIDRLQNVIDVHINQHNTSLADLESISAEFRETIAGSMHILKILDRAMKHVDGQDKNRMQINHLARMLEDSSLAPISLSRKYLTKEGQEIAHHLGRHTGQEGADLVGGFTDFLEDFGGEVISFVAQNKVLTIGLGLSFWFLMSAANNQGGGADMANQLASSCSSTGQSGLLSVSGGFAISEEAFMSGEALNLASSSLQNEVTEMSCDGVEQQFGVQAIKQCHFHLPVKVPYFEHCLISDQAVVQLNEGIELIKGPLNMILDAPADGINLLAPRDPDEVPFFFAENFKTSLRSTGDVWFVLNGYQNLSHAPWAATATSMGFKLGTVAALAKTSGLVRPLYDGAIGLFEDNKYLISTIPSAAYGYSEQGVSGAIMATVLGTGASYTALGIHRGVQGLANIQSFKHSQTKYNRAERALSAQSEYYETPSGILVPEHITLDKNTINLFEKSDYPTLNLKIGGEDYALELTDEKYEALLDELIGFIFILENMPDKLGIEPQEEDPEMNIINKAYGHSKSWSCLTDMPYRDYLQRSSAHCLESLKEYKENPGSEVNLWTLERRMQQHINTVAGAQMIHLDQFMENLSRRQKGELRINAKKTERQFDRAQSHRNDWDKLRKLGFNAGRSLDYTRHLPFTTSASLGTKAISASATGAKMLLRGGWSALRDDAIPYVHKKYNAISPETKGTAIGSLLTLTAAAINVDANPEIQQSIKDTLSFGEHGAEAARIFLEVTDKLGLHYLSPQEQKEIIESARIIAAKDMPQSVIDGVTTYSGATGHVAGAGTASGLFAVYNFLEDHLIVHLSMGYVCILAGGGGRLAADMAAAPLGGAANVAKYFNDQIANHTKGVIDAKKPIRAMKQELRDLKRLSRNIIEFDKEYLPELVVK